MSRAEFEEKEYEIGMAIELSSRSASGVRVYPCGQVLEEILGYDAAADPERDHPIWAVIEASRPRGVRLVPAFWNPGLTPPGDRLPPEAVSLILQYKRPEYLRGARAKQWKLWWHPYYRFAIVAHQQRVLKRIETASGTSAIVRYACPALHTRGSFERARSLGTLALESGYVAPSALDGHRVWTFTEPGIDGHANPSGRRQRFETLEETLRATVHVATLGGRDVVPARWRPTGLFGLAEASRNREPRLRARVDSWIAHIRSLNLELTTDQLAMLASYAALVTSLSDIGASWHLVAPSPK